MKKHGIINSHISEVISRMGHTDTIVIADCGLPIPEGVRRIDLAYELGRPGFLEILDALLADFRAEEVTLALEIKENNAGIYDEICDRIGEIPIEFVAHSHFKDMTRKAVCVIRTGENTPYANIILHSGVIF